MPQAAPGVPTLPDFKLRHYRMGFVDECAGDRGNEFAKLA